MKPKGPFALSLVSTQKNHSCLKIEAHGHDRSKKAANKSRMPTSTDTTRGSDATGFGRGDNAPAPTWDATSSKPNSEGQHWERVGMNYLCRINLQEEHAFLAILGIWWTCYDWKGKNCLTCPQLSTRLRAQCGQRDLKIERFGTLDLDSRISCSQFSCEGVSALITN